MNLNLNYYCDPLLT